MIGVTIQFVIWGYSKHYDDMVNSHACTMCGEPSASETDGHSKYYLHVLLKAQRSGIRCSFLYEALNEI